MVPLPPVAAFCCPPQIVVSKPLARFCRPPQIEPPAVSGSVELPPLALLSWPPLIELPKPSAVFLYPPLTVESLPLAMLPEPPPTDDHNPLASFGPPAYDSRQKFTRGIVASAAHRCPATRCNVAPAAAYRRVARARHVVVSSANPLVCPGTSDARRTATARLIEGPPLTDA